MPLGTNIIPEGENYKYYKDLGKGSSAFLSVLPAQAIASSKKTPAWEKATLDSLEQEAIFQYSYNLKYKDYYDMLSGKMVYTDIDSKDRDYLYAQVRQVQKETSLPSNLKHFDLMYPLVSTIVGEMLLSQEVFRIDTIDECSTNEYLRERSQRLFQYAKYTFEMELNKLLLLDRIDQNDKGSTQEEFEQKQALIQQKITEYYPDKIDNYMRYDWKTNAAKWFDNVWKRDQERFRIQSMERQEAIHFMLTGKSPRHYRIGYDYYMPETWHPIETFHSKDADITNFQDCEYVGRLKWNSISDILTIHGFLLSTKIQEQLSRAFSGDVAPSSGTSGGFNVYGKWWEQYQVPFAGYFDYKTQMAHQDTSGVPMGLRKDVITGNTTDHYLPQMFNNQGSGTGIQVGLRNDFPIRRDTIQTMETYWRGFKRIGLLTYRDEAGILTRTEVNEDILVDFLKEYKIKTVTSKSLLEYNLMTPQERENTVIWSYVPIVYKGLKINLSTCMGIEEDFYFVEELPYQIRGEKGHLYDVKLPVCGIITEAPVEKIKTYQQLYNFVNNQTSTYLQKEIGALFVFDVNLLPTEYLESLGGNNENALLKFRNFVKKTSMFPIDASKHNTFEKGGLPGTNMMSYQNLSLTDQIQRNMQLAEQYKWQAYNLLGITQQRLGTPNQYSTAEGIQVGQQASFSQTAGLFFDLSEDKRLKIETHLTVAQYAQLNNKDVNYVYLAGDDEMNFVQSIKDDKDFDLRKVAVRPINSANKRKQVDTLKQVLISNNTLGGDLLAISEVLMSDDYLSLMEAARKARAYAEQQQSQQQQGQQQQLQAAAEEGDKERQFKMGVEKLKSDTDIEVAKLNSLARTAQGSREEGDFDIIRQEAGLDNQNALKEKEINQKDTAAKMNYFADLQKANSNLDLKLRELELKEKKLDLDHKKSDDAVKISLYNKN